MFQTRLPDVECRSEIEIVQNDKNNCHKLHFQEKLFKKMFAKKAIYKDKVFEQTRPVPAEQAFLLMKKHNMQLVSLNVKASKFSKEPEILPLMESKKYPKYYIPAQDVIQGEQKTMSGFTALGDQ